MVFWIAIGVVTAVSLIALALPIRAASSNQDAVENDVDDESAAARVFYEQQLAELKNDLSATKLGNAEFESAKLELDRELLRQSHMTSKTGAMKFSSPLLLGISVPLIATIAIFTYLSVGNPGKSDLPLVERIQQGDNIDIADAIIKIEKRLQDVPDDLQGWRVIAPVYMRQNEFAKASNAFENIVRIEGESADNLTNLAEVKVLLQNGDASGEPAALLQRAIELEPNHLRARFYLAGEATRAGEFETAIAHWNNVLRDTVGDEPWLEAARAGLKAAEDGLQTNGQSADGPSQEDVDAVMDLSEADRAAVINSMVDGLSERLFQLGGSPQEWQRLIRARLVQGEADLAKKALDAARVNLQSDSDKLVEFETIAATELAEIKKLEE